jgi:cystathionine beta-lyase
MDEKTRLIHARGKPRPLARTVGPPVQKGSTVLLPNAEALYGEKLGYGRAGLEAQFTLMDALAELEGATSVQLYPSGLAALTGAMLAVLKAGDHLLAADSVYRPTRFFCERTLGRYGVEVEFYDPAAGPEALMAQVRPNTRLIVLESPGSLTFDMQDAPGIAAAAKSRGVLTLMDNTWGAGLLFKPLAHGIDISVQALTKYVGGHSDLFMGSAAARDPAVGEILKTGIHELGWSVSGEDAYTALRGLRTLATRLDQHGRSGLAVAEWLATQPEVTEILHPALPGARGHDLWKRDYAGACGLFGLTLTPGPKAAVDAFLDALSLFGLGFSWGGFESLAIGSDHQLSVRRFTPQLRGPLLRLHIGLEAPQDLIADLRTGLDAYSARL